VATHIYFGVLSPAHIGSRDSGRLVLNTLLETAPEWSPEKYNDFEPVNRLFDPGRLEQALDVWRFNFLWRRKKPAVHGSAWFGGKIHSSIYLQIAPRAFAIDAFFKLLRGLRRHFPLDLAYIHVEHESDCRDRDRYRRHVEPFIIGLTTHRLREGLPDLPWATLFGPPYVELFGRERLLTTPAAYVQELAGGVYVQLTNSVADVSVRRESYLAAQTAARLHLNSGAFLGDTAPNQLRVPEFICPVQ
jgi:hypothetical protein